MTGKVFLDYDQAQLDREMNLRGRWPEHQSYFDRWARDSLHVRKTYKCHSDLVYGDTAGQKLDLFLPEVRQAEIQEAEIQQAEVQQAEVQDAEAWKVARKGGGTPLLAFIHGGYWKSLDKGDFSYLAPAYLERGIAFASLNYDLSPGADIGTMVAQVRRGLAWLIRRAGDYGLDPSGLYIAGHSAGGHLAAMAMNPAWTADFGLPAEVIKGGCSVSGVYDLKPVALSFQQEELRIAPEIVKNFCPLFDIPDAAAPLICAVGSEETAEFIRQQGVYLEAWRQKGLACQAVDLPGDNHFTAADRLGERDHPLYLAVIDMISPDNIV